eukprot:gb/GEZN01007321.1/.p1 GENE.gb/GEZN01007321.1/~~gb/GEZN01007321.1/.p1  ORF type:complete len:219 (-),score=47.79 gb/GEZN01007321.1/:194-850(-)
MLTFVLSTLLAGALSASVTLTTKGFEEAITGKAAFVMFFAPWCGHCKKMKPDWEKLGGDFSASKTVLIGNVDCTVEKDLCSKFGVQGYPTIKYFTGNTAADGDKYEGGRTYDDLKTWADENLGPSCGMATRELCSAEQLEKMDAVAALPKADRDAEIATIEKAIADAETRFKEEVQKLQEMYQKLQADNEKAKTDHGPRLKLLRMVNAYTPEAAKEEL